MDGPDGGSGGDGRGGLEGGRRRRRRWQRAAVLMSADGWSQWCWRSTTALTAARHNNKSTFVPAASSAAATAPPGRQITTVGSADRPDTKLVQIRRNNLSPYRASRRALAAARRILSQAWVSYYYTDGALHTAAGHIIAPCERYIRRVRCCHVGVGPITEPSCIKPATAAAFPIGDVE